jgi:hypothetical protein
MSSIFKSPERVLYRRLVTSPLFALRAGFRVYPMLAPSSAEVPFVVYERTGIERNATLGGLASARVPLVTVSLTIYGVSYIQCRELADICRDSLDGYGLASYGTEVKRATLDVESDGLAQLEGGELPPVYQVTQSYDVLWQEI